MLTDEQRMALSMLIRSTVYHSSMDSTEIVKNIEETIDSCAPKSEAAAGMGAVRRAGYKLVPVEPTQAMLDRGYYPCVQGRGAKSVWGEMLRAVKEPVIDAAPQPAQTAVPAGYKLVPTEPTPLMSSAGFAVSEAEHDPSQVYRVMIEAAPQPASEPTERVTPYDGLLAEFVDEVARLCNDAPGSRNAVYSALQHCNVNIVPAAQPASEQQAAREFSDDEILAVYREEAVHVCEECAGHDALVVRTVRAILAAKGDGHA